MPQLIPPPIDAPLLALIRLAVEEDLGSGDRTVELAIPQNFHVAATIVARKPGIIAGTFLLPAILREYQRDITCTLLTPDGQRLQTNQAVATLSGSARAILSAERVVLNFLGHLSGIATLTGQYVDTVARAVPDASRRPAICDIRKTTPGFARSTNMPFAAAAASITAWASTTASCLKTTTSRHCASNSVNI